MKFRKLFVVCCAAVTLGQPLVSQTRLDLQTQAKRVNFTEAQSTKPFKAGMVLPPVCSAGEVFFLQSAPAGKNIYACVAPNVWTVQGASGSEDILQMRGAPDGVASLTSDGTIPESELPAGIYQPFNENLQSLSALTCVDGQTVQKAGGAWVCMDSNTGVKELGTFLAGTLTVPDVNTALIPTRAGVQSGADIYVQLNSSSGTAFTGLIAGRALESYSDGMVLQFRPNRDCAGAPTLNVDTLGAKNLYEFDGTAPMVCTAGFQYALWFDATANNGAGGWRKFAGSVSGTFVSTGTTVPALCSANTFFIKTDSPAGQNLYACLAGTFVPQTSSGGTVADLKQIPTRSYTDLQNIPTSFTPEAHTHGQSEITGLAADLAGKAGITHTHGAGAITTGTLADARISATSVVQHQSALAIAAGQITSGTLAAARLPGPTVGALGGVRARTCSGTDKVSGIGTDGVPVCSGDSQGVTGLGMYLTGTLATPDVNTALIATRANLQSGSDVYIRLTSTNTEAFTGTIPGSPLNSYTDAMVLQFRPNTACTEQPTLDVDGVGAKNLYESSGSTPMTCTSGTQLPIWYDAAANAGVGAWRKLAGSAAATLTTGTTIQKADGAGGFTPAVPGTDYVTPFAAPFYQLAPENLGYAVDTINGGVANQIVVARRVLLTSYTITNADIFQQTAGGAGCVVAAGIYSTTGTRVWSGTGNCSSISGGVVRLSGTTVTIPPGTYLFAWSQPNTTATFMFTTVATGTVTSANAGAGGNGYTWVYQYIPTATQAMAGSMPETLNIGSGVAFWSSIRLPALVFKQ